MMKTLLIKLKNLYIQYTWISIMKKGGEDVKVEKMVVFVKTFDHYHYKFNFGNFFRLQKNLKMKFRWKFNCRFTNQGG